MIDYSQAFIELVSLHHAGNRHNNGRLLLSQSGLDISSPNLKNLLKKYFLSPFTSDDLYSFTWDENDFTQNPLYVLAKQIFEDQDGFHNNSIEIAKLLFEASDHPQIKEGDLFVAYISDMVVVDEIVSCIGIFKSENHHPFLRLNSTGRGLELDIIEGINIEKLDKGCLIFNTDGEFGYKAAIIDKTSKAGEAHFWRDGFLRMHPADDDYHRTKDFLTVTRNFITKQIPDDLEVDRGEKAELLNRSMDYFKNKDSFNRADFEDKVLKNKGMIDSFRDYDNNYRKRKNIEFIDDFDISAQAVNKQERFYRQVLKLDNNFHVYIHGAGEMIEHGVEPGGRKYYKLYYNEER